MKYKALISTISIMIIAFSSLAQVTGTFIDVRDSIVYKTVQMDGQIWMAENLKYKTDSNSWCYDNNDSLCLKYGKLYSWEVAKKACPCGWHLPNDQEWQTMEIEGNVSDIILGGYRIANDVYIDKDYNGYWWSSSGYYVLYNWNRYMNYFDSWSQRYMNNLNKNSGLSVRCVKD